MIVDICASKVSLFLDKFILLCKTLCSLLTDLLLTELRLIVVLLTHSIKIVFHHLLLATHLFNSCHLLITEVPITVSKLLLLFITSLTGLFFILLFLLESLLLLSTPLEYLIIIFVL